ncbi:hypothetical protein AMECASPLE_038203 [Ameca splendens]|uniref:Uncharacterized protein n=1 Tax=Ameca splendens TaxID=208324 RepID=A0ABV0Z6Y9_9TELE
MFEQCEYFWKAQWLETNVLLFMSYYQLKFWFRVIHSCSLHKLFYKPLSNKVLMLNEKLFTKQFEELLDGAAVRLVSDPVLVQVLSSNQISGMFSVVLFRPSGLPHHISTSL